MSFINYAKKEIHCKIIYCGPGLSGKTTNVQYIFDQTNPDGRGKLVALSTENERTLFFDFLPLDGGEINGFKVRFLLYTIPGQTFYEISRQFILKGVDGIVFVADSQPERMEANIESQEALKKNLDSLGYDIYSIPFVYQYNKRDAQGALALTELEGALNGWQRPFFEAIANKGQGVMETLEHVSSAVLQQLNRGKTSEKGNSKEVQKDF